MNQFYTTTDHFVLTPAIMLALFGCAILLFDFWVFPNPKQRKSLLLFVILGLGFTGYSLWKQQAFLVATGQTELIGFQGALTIDRFALYFNWVFELATLIVAIVSYNYLEIEGEHHGEYYSLLLFAQCGMFFLSAGTDLVTLFIGLELMALCFYVMVGFLRSDKRSNEAAMKYLLLGAFSSGFLVYGFSIMYGISGSTRLTDVAAAIAARDAWDPVVFLAMVTTSVGLLFKISAAPFHMWAPDAYEGAPTTITAYLSVASKAASFAFLLRIFLGPLASARASWEPLLAAVAVLTMTIGNLAAISQSNIKRLLAYSSISHAGYMLLGLVAGNETGIQGILVYVLVYTFMNLGAFLVVLREGRHLREIHPSIYVKCPMTPNGLRATKILAKEGTRVNMTLVFSANQALLAAKVGAQDVSPFIGRLPGAGRNGPDPRHRADLPQLQGPDAGARGQRAPPGPCTRCREDRGRYRDYAVCRHGEARSASADRHSRSARFLKDWEKVPK